MKIIKLTLVCSLLIIGVYGISYGQRLLDDLKSEEYCESQMNTDGAIRLGFYEHYKGMPYQVLGVARHSETLEELVVYKALYGERGLWVRPKKMFFETVIVNGAEVPRFRFVKEA